MKKLLNRIDKIDAIGGIKGLCFLTVVVCVACGVILLVSPLVLHYSPAPESIPYPASSATRQSPSEDHYKIELEKIHAKLDYLIGRK